MLWIKLSDDEAECFKTDARVNYEPFSPIEVSVWHPKL